MSKEQYSGSSNIEAIKAFLADVEGLNSDQKAQVIKMLKAFALIGTVGVINLFNYAITIENAGDRTTITAEKIE